MKHRSWRSWIKALLALAVVAGYPLAMHLLLTSNRWPALTLLLAVLPFGLGPLMLLVAGQRRAALLALAALLAAAAWGGGALLRHPDAIYLLQNLGMQALMAAVFGRTLLPGQEPLIAQFARRIHGADYSPRIARYARQATWAWTLYFLAMGLASVLLFVAAPLALWSWFVNFLSFVLLGLMFAGEYAVRRWRLRGVPHVSLRRSVALYWERPAPDSAPGSPWPR